MITTRSQSQKAASLVKVIALDWDMTLYHPMKEVLYENANLLFAELKKIGLPIYIVTANPDANIQAKIKRVLEENAIDLDMKYIRWGGRTQYIDHHMGGYDKVQVFNRIANEEHIELSQILFIDARAEYIQVAKDNLVQTMLVDPGCFNSRNMFEVNENLTAARNRFYDNIVQYIKQNKLDNAPPQSVEQPAPQKNNNDYFKLLLVASLSFALLLTGAFVFAAIYATAPVAFGIAIGGAIAYLASMVILECKRQKCEARKLDKEVAGFFDEESSGDDYDTGRKLGTSARVADSLRGGDVTVYDPAESIVNDYSEDDFFNEEDAKKLSAPLLGNSFLNDDKAPSVYSEGSFRAVTSNNR